jgi:hypothetical protein
VNAKQSWGKLLLLLEDRSLWDGLKVTEDESNPRILDTISDTVVVRVGWYNSQKADTKTQTSIYSDVECH